MGLVGAGGAGCGAGPTPWAAATFSPSCSRTITNGQADARPEEMRRHGQGKSGDSCRVSRLFIVAGPRWIPPSDSFQKARDRGRRRHARARRVRFPEQLPSASRPRLVLEGSPPSGPTPLPGFPPPGLRGRPDRTTVSRPWSQVMTCATGWRSARTLEKLFPGSQRSVGKLSQELRPAAVHSGYRPRSSWETRESRNERERDRQIPFFRS